jgi:hypothetical protein
MKVGLLLGLKLVALAALPARADTVFYDNGAPCCKGWWLSNGGLADAVINSFVPVVTGTLTAANIAVFDGSDPSQTGTPLNTLNWYIRANDNPSNALSASILAQGAATPTATTFDGVSGQQLAISSPVLSAGTTYWFELQGISGNSDEVWHTAGPANPAPGNENRGTGHSSIQVSGGYNSGWGPYGPADGYSSSFQLVGSATSVPEPSSVVLLAGMLLLMAMVLMIRRNSIKGRQRNTFAFGAFVV